MDVSQTLSERSLGELLRRAIDARVEGLVVLRDREGLRHGIWVREGYVLGAHVAGHHDPLFALLRTNGALSERGHRACMEALYRSDLRSGLIARTLAGVAPELVHHALGAQLVARFASLLAIAKERGHDAHLERGAVPERERSVRMPLGSLLRRSRGGASGAQPGECTQARDEARRQLRLLARALHPDRYPALDPEARARLAEQLARATAQYHGFA